MPILETIALVTGVIGIVRSTYSCVNSIPSRQHIASAVLERSGQCPVMAPESVRSAFAALPVVRQREVEGHTHGISAADRSSGSLYADNLAATTGKTAYFYQRSRADERAGRDGSRTYFWSKDLTTKVCAYKPPTNALLTFIDVDMYVDMPTYLTDEFQTVLIYTVQPTSTARAGKEYSYTFNKDNELEYNVSGGGIFKHKVWNYGSDHLLVRKTFCGITYKAAAYLIDKHATDRDHELILLTPVKKWTGIASWFASYIHGKPLDRLAVADGEYTRMLVRHKDKLVSTTSKVGGYLTAETLATNDEAIALLAAESKYDLNIASIEKYFPDKQQAIMSWSFHRRKVNFKGPLISPVEQHVRRYQYEPSNFDPSYPSSMVSFMRPIIDEGFAPDSCPANDRAYVDARILELRKEPVPEVTPFAIRVMHEFLKFMIPEPHLGVPVDIDFVMDKQNRPSQRRIIYDAQFREAQHRVGSFMKKESYDEPKHPRPITTIDGPTKVEYSKFIYAMSEHLKTMPWYAFGKKPVQVAQRVASVCEFAEHSVLPTDASRWDGRIKQILRLFEKFYLMRFFATQYHEQACELHSRHKGAVAHTTHGVSYETDDERGSGNPETAVFNSSENCLSAYYCARRRGMTPEEAWNSLGIYGGDDGLTPDADPVLYTKHCLELGIVIKAKVIKRGEAGVNMLGRIYGPDVWHGDTNSMCDIVRIMSKLHLTVSMPSNITPSKKLFEKSFALYLTDRNTPVVGPLVKLAVQFGQSREMVYDNLIRDHLVELDEALQYPNQDDDWMYTYVRSVFPEADFDKLEKHLRSCKSLEELLVCPTIQERKPPKPQDRPVVADGEIIYPAKEKAPAKKAAKGKPGAPKGKKFVKKQQAKRDDSARS